MDWRWLLVTALVVVVIGGVVWVAAQTATAINRAGERGDDPDLPWLAISPILYVVRRWLRRRG